MSAVKEFIQKIRNLPLSKKKQIVFFTSFSVVAVIGIVWAFTELPQKLKSVDTEEISASLKKFGEIKDSVSISGKDSETTEDNGEKTKNFLPLEDKERKTLTLNQNEGSEEGVKLDEEKTQSITQTATKENTGVGVAFALKEEGNLILMTEIYNMGDESIVYSPINTRIIHEDKEYFPQNANELLGNELKKEESVQYKMVFDLDINEGDIKIIFPEVPIDKNTKEDFYFEITLNIPKEQANNN